MMFEKSKARKIVFLSLLAATLIIGVLHHLTPSHMILYHDSFRRISYFPIVIGAILYGLRGGVAVSLLTCLFYMPHLFKFWAVSPQVYYSELSEVIFYMAAGVVVGLISSRENKLREQLKRSYQRLHDQAEKLVNAEKQLGKSQRLSMLGHVSASLAHEIKNPLASIKGAAEIVADDLPEDHPKHEFIKIIRSEISRLNGSVEDVLTYCRGEQAKNKTKPEPVDQIVERAISLVDSRTRNKKISVTNNADPSGRAFMTDSAAVTQVLLNILLNAIDAVDKHGEITIDQFAENGGFAVAVTDNGPGIDENRKKDLFEPFVTYKEGGTGLGLSISKRIVESLGGEIAMEDPVSGGARFVVHLKPMASQTGQEKI